MIAHPVNDWVLVELFPLPERTYQGIILPQGAAGSDFRFAKVIESGPGKDFENGTRCPTGLLPGDIVVFHRWHTQHKSGQIAVDTLSDDGVERGLIKPEDVLLVVEDPPEPENFYDIIRGS